MDAGTNSTVCSTDFEVKGWLWKAYLILIIRRKTLYYRLFSEGGISLIGDILKRTRTIYGYKASELSELLGISKSYLSEIENNKKQPSLELLEKYSKIYDMKVSSLILLSENYEDASKNNKGDKFIRNMMIKLIEKMTPNLEE